MRNHTIAAAATLLTAASAHAQLVPPINNTPTTQTQPAPTPQDPQPNNTNAENRGFSTPAADRARQEIAFNDLQAIDLIQRNDDGTVKLLSRPWVLHAIEELPLTQKNRDDIDKALKARERVVAERVLNEWDTFNQLRNDFANVTPTTPSDELNAIARRAAQLRAYPVAHDLHRQGLLTEKQRDAAVAARSIYAEALQRQILNSTSHDDRHALEYATLTQLAFDDYVGEPARVMDKLTYEALNPGLLAETPSVLETTTEKEWAILRDVLENEPNRNQLLADAAKRLEIQPLPGDQD